MRWCIAFFLCVSSLPLFAQDSLYMEGITAASQDANGLLYIGLNNGEIVRLTEELEIDLRYAPERVSPVTLVDASNRFRIFVHYENLQEFVLLDRFLTESARYSLKDQTSFASIAAPSQNNSVWVLDTQNFTIQKVNPLLNQVEFTVPLEQLLPPGNYRGSYICEYQNLLFISDPNRGVILFDNLGNLLNRIEQEGIYNFSFYEDTLIAPTADGLLEYNIYSQELTNNVLKMTGKWIFKNNSGYWVVTENGVLSKKNLE